MEHDARGKAALLPQGLVKVCQLLCPAQNQACAELSVLQSNLLFFTKEKLKARKLAKFKLLIHGRVASCWTSKAPL